MKRGEEMKTVHENLVELINLMVKGHLKHGASPEELAALAELVKVALNTKDVL